MQGSAPCGGGLCRPACHCHAPAAVQEAEREGGRGTGVRPNSHFWQQPPRPLQKTEKGVKVLNIKLSRTPALPTHLGGIPIPGTVCGLWWGVTWKLTPQQKPAPCSPRAKYLRGWGGLSPAEVLRSSLLQPLVTRTEKAYLGLLSVPAPPFLPEAAQTYATVTPSTQERKPSCPQAWPPHATSP